MTKWFVLFRKEYLQMIRNYTIIWLPISFIVLGASQPITSFFMPDILSSAGNLPEGSVISIPAPMPFEVMQSSLSQFGVIGLLLVSLTSMSALSNERSSGTAAMILVKPVSFVSFVTAKWAANLSLTVISFTFGYCTAWYYTSTLFSPLNFKVVVLGALFFALWLSFVGTLNLMFSSLIRSAAAAAFSALASAAMLSIASNTLPFKWSWNPGQLPGLAANSLDETARLNGSTFSILITVVITILAIVMALIVAAISMRRQPSDG
ncbi:ABC transporter permease subunit [Paenibacillus sp. ATY16]|uniref:ABC transporter permease n=1 Tax=Paenibacillus sp. ATY16 TaxID=1759312 RepID=UPI00200FED1F|nr:ABC transporter permease subunit [Paenibacillus sp. ATY16]MCK9858664.1 ABC transporter permease [Paenibacillus sp. ATY16]